MKMKMWVRKPVLALLFLTVLAPILLYTDKLTTFCMSFSFIFIYFFLNLDKLTLSIRSLIISVFAATYEFVQEPSTLVRIPNLHDLFNLCIFMFSNLILTYVLFGFPSDVES